MAAACRTHARMLIMCILTWMIQRCLHLQEIGGTVFGYDPVTDVVMIREQGTHAGVVNLRLYKASQLEVSTSAASASQAAAASKLTAALAGTMPAAVQVLWCAAQV